MLAWCASKSRTNAASHIASCQWQNNVAHAQHNSTVETCPLTTPPLDPLTSAPPSPLRSANHMQNSVNNRQHHTTTSLYLDT